MFKKIALISACLAVSTAASATGLYVGAGLGYQTFMRDSSTTIDTIPALGIISTSSLDNRNWGQSAVGQLFVGYGFCLSQNFWLGLEFNGELSDARSRNEIFDVFAATTSFDWNRSARYRGGFGLSFRPGFFPSDQTKIYAVLGWQRGRFDITDDETYTLVGVQTFGNLSASRWLDGFRYGGGIETNFTGQLGGRLEFTQTRYSHFSHNTDFSAAVLAGSTGSVYSTNEKPFTNEVVASLVWTVGDLFNVGGVIAS